MYLQISLGGGDWTELCVTRLCLSLIRLGEVLAILDPRQELSIRLPSPMGYDPVPLPNSTHIQSESGWGVVWGGRFGCSKCEKHPFGPKTQGSSPGATNMELDTPLFGVRNMVHLHVSSRVCKGYISILK